MDKCLWIGSGYPVFIAAVSILWIAYQKSQDKLLAEKEEKVRILIELKRLLEQRKKKQRGDHGPL